MAPMVLYHVSLFLLAKGMEKGTVPSVAGVDIVRDGDQTWTESGGR